MFPRMASHYYLKRLEDAYTFPIIVLLNSFLVSIDLHNLCLLGDNKNTQTLS